MSKIYDTANSSPTIGYGVWVTHEEGWTTCYFHLLDTAVKLGDTITDGRVIGHADNTGQYTMGTHLHFGLYPKDKDLKNGYGGAIDPMPYFNFLNNKKMEYVKQGSEQYLRTNDPFKIAFNIGDEKVLAKLISDGLKGSPTEVTDIATYKIYPLIDKDTGSEIIKRLKDLLGF